MSTLAITGPACLVADLGSQNPFDPQKLRAARWNGVACEGVILRATRSTGEIDQQFAVRYAVASRLGFLVGAYDFNTGEAAAVQAARFLKATAGRPGLARVLDFERNPSGAQMTLAMAIEWLDRVDQATGFRAWLYSGDQIKSLVTKATAAQRDFLGQHLFWGCEYGPTFKLFDDNGKRLPWTNAALWQFTGDGVGPEPRTLDGLEEGADLSIFNGTRADLEKIWSGAPVVTQARWPAASAVPPLPAVTAAAAPEATAPAPKPAARAFDWFFDLFGPA